MAASNSDNKKVSIWGILLFIAYLMLLFYFLFLSEGMGRSEGSEYRYNLTLLKEISRYWNYMMADTADTFRIKLFLLNVVGNVVAFIPYGFFVPIILQNKNVILTTVFGLLFSLVIEVVQLLLKVGSFDVDDILLNTIGTIIGVLIYRLFAKIRKK